MPLVKFRVGKQRLVKNLRPWEDSYTRDIRAQVKQLEKNYRKFLDLVSGESPRIIEATLRPIFDRSQELVPVDTGKLKQSGYIAVRSFRGRIQGEVGYAKGGVPFYAVIVHEDPNFKHKPPTQYKFLQKAVEENQGKLLDQVADGYSEILGG